MAPPDDRLERERLEAQLRDMAARLAETQRIAGVGDFRCNLQTGSIEWSDEMFRVFGRDPSLGPPSQWEDARQYFTHESWGKFQDALARFHSSETGFEIELELLRPDDERHFVILRGKPEADSTGIIRRLRGTVKDVTQARRTEQALAEREEILRLFVEHAPASQLMFDKNMLILAASRRWIVDHGFEDRDIVGHSLYEIIPDLPQRWKAINVRCLAGEVLSADHDRFDRADGSVIFLRWEVRPWRHANGEVGGVILFMEDITERTQSQERLEHSEERLGAILDAVDACIYLKDQQGRYLFANKAVRRIWNAELSEVVGCTDEKFFDAATAAHVREIDRRVLENGETLRELESVAVLGTGESVTYLTFKLPLRNSNGDIHALCGISTDVTERVRAERQLIDSERRYRSLFENMNTGFLLYEVVQDDSGAPVDLVILAANRVVEEATGLAIADMLGKRLTAVLPGIENDPADWIGTYGRVALTGEPVQFSRYSDLMRTHPAVAAYQPAPRQCAVTFQDITQRVRAEEEIRRLNADLERRVAERTADVQAKERFLRTIADVAPGVLGYWDSDLRNRFANRRYLEWFGMTPEQIEGRGLSEVFGEDFIALLDPHVRAVLKGESRSFERPMIRADGATGYALTRFAPDIVDGMVRGFVVAASDITEIKRAQAELSEQASEYEDLYNNAPCGYHSLDRDGVIIRINDTELSWFGLAREEVVSKRRLVEFLSEKSQATYACLRPADGFEWHQAARHRLGRSVGTTGLYQAAPGTYFFDTSLNAMILFDGATWRSPAGVAV